MPSYDTPSKTGHWRVALMRCTSRGDVLVSLICVRNQLTEVSPYSAKQLTYFMDFTCIFVNKFIMVCLVNLLDCLLL